MASGPVVSTYDARGNLTSAGGATFIYTAENRLWHMHAVASFNHDPLGRLMQSVGAVELPRPQGERVKGYLSFTIC